MSRTASSDCLIHVVPVTLTLPLRLLHFLQLQIKAAEGIGWLGEYPAVVGRPTAPQRRLLDRNSAFLSVVACLAADPPFGHELFNQLALHFYLLEFGHGLAVLNGQLAFVSPHLDSLDLAPALLTIGS